MKYTRGGRKRLRFIKKTSSTALSRKNNIYSKVYAEVLKKKVTAYSLLTRQGNEYHMWGGQACNVLAVLAQTSYFLNVLSSQGVANFQRFRVTGVALEFYPNYLSPGNTPVSLPPFVVSLFADLTTLIDLNGVAVDQAVLDQADRMLILPQQTSRPQRKFWAFPKNAISSGNGVEKTPLGVYVNTERFITGTTGGVAWPGIFIASSLSVPSGLIDGASLGVIAMEIYVECCKPVR